jgi:copper(I)-binding protein
MPHRLTLFALSLVLAAGPGLAEIVIEDAYARSSGPSAKAGAGFMLIENSSNSADRLISATSEAAARVELHTHKEEDGVMRMVEVEEGFEIPAGGVAVLERGGNHVMFMGLTEGWAQGDLIPVTLIFERAGEVALEIPVDLERKANHGSGHGMDHSKSGN